MNIGERFVTPEKLFCGGDLTGREDLAEQGKLTPGEASSPAKEISCMMPAMVKEQVPAPPPSYRRAQAKQGPALHINAVTTLHLLTLCRVAVRLAHRRCPPPLPAGPGGAPRTYTEESLLLISLLRTLWRLSYQETHDWLRDWPALALACGLPLGKDGDRKG